IFEPFHRGDATGGHGLGLAIARRALAAHRGTIAAANRAGGGLEVTMTLPATGCFSRGAACHYPRRLSGPREESATMKAAWYEKKGAARDVLRVGERPDPQPAAGEVRVRIRMSAVNPSDTKSRGG